MAKILNLSRLQKRLDRMPDVAKARIRAAMEEQAHIIVTMMKSLVPVDSGALRESIGWTWGAAPKDATIVGKVASKLGKDLTLTFFAGSDAAYYARMVEFGTARHAAGGRFKGSEHPGTDAQPFFYVSWRANKKGATRAIRKAVRDAAKQVASTS